MSRSVEIAWNPPLLEERNGNITSYSITISRQGSDSLIQLTSPITSITVSMLNPFTTYTVTVTASTSIGVGPPSTLLNFRTAEDGTMWMHVDACAYLLILTSVSFQREVK